VRKSLIGMDSWAVALDRAERKPAIQAMNDISSG
jgi:hypothetical protein